VFIASAVFFQRDQIITNTPVTLQHDKAHVFWTIRVGNDVSSVWDNAAKIKQVKTWGQVTSSKSFKRLNPVEKNRVHEQYWKEVVLPQILHPNIVNIIGCIFIIPAIFLYLISCVWNYVQERLKRDESSGRGRAMGIAFLKNKNIQTLAFIGIGVYLLAASYVHRGPFVHIEPLSAALGAMFLAGAFFAYQRNNVAKNE